ncbi:MAG: serine hydrolase [Candidatus Marinimicrobia bacterium]|nr:serine hydrolase [Candidatus Neomarinimicrobiota bacterium]
MSTVRKIFTLIMPALLVLSCASGPGTAPPSHWRTQPVNASDLTLRQQIGQLIALRIEGKYYSGDHSYRADLSRFVREDQVGGLITYRGSVEGTYANLVEFQAMAEIPLLIAADYERGVGQLIAGATQFPSNMGIAATFNEQNAYEQGRITAIESRAMGIHVTYAPVMDVNNNPLNPIINFRAYSDDPQIVAKFGAAFIRGAQDHGLVATAKHFPGHGNTSTDSHTSLPIIPGELAEIEKVELPPFQAASDAQVGMIMVAHIAVPSLEKEIMPATYSRAITTDLLRGRMGFKGIIVTDGMEMGAVTAKDWTGEAAVKAVLAGNDMILLPLHVTGTIDAIERAVLSGRISREQIATSAQRVLDLKARLGLYAERGNLTRQGVQQIVGNSESLAIASRIAAESITLVKDDDGQIPLRLGRRQTLTHLVVSMDHNVRGQMMPLWQNIEWTLGKKRVTTRIVNEELSKARIKELVAQAKKSDKVLVSFLVRIHMNKGESSIDLSHKALLDGLRKAGIKPIVASFGSPYLPDIDRMSTYLAGYYYGAVSLRAMADALFGRAAITGRLPVQLSPKYPRGHGLVRDAIADAFEPSSRNVDFGAAFKAIRNGIEEKVMPGAQIFIAQGGKVLADTAFGRFTYDDDAAWVTTGSIYDLASVTKVLAGGTVAMCLVERRYLVLDEPVWHYYPEFTGGGKELVTVRHLLTHSSGLRPFYEFWKLGIQPDEVLAYIIDSDLDFEPGSQYQYSDLGMVLFTALAERVTGRPFEKLVRQWVTGPMRLKNTAYNPPDEWLARIVPTEVDNSLRMALVHGTVHDENTYFMGGVSAHAGLFSTARELAHVGALILGEGMILGQRMLQPETIRQFTTDQQLPAGSGRALAWQMAYATGHSGEKFSAGAFGHTGYTGTSIWIDPATDLIAVMLTNRVHPTRERGGMRDVRLAFYNAVAEAVGSGGRPLAERGKK